MLGLVLGPGKQWTEIDYSLTVAVMDYHTMIVCHRLPWTIINIIMHRRLSQIILDNDKIIIVYDSLSISNR